jgi:hypothetical protein
MPDTTTATVAALIAAPLNAITTLALAAIVTAAHEGTKVGRSMPDSHQLAGKAVYGTARAIVTDTVATRARDGDDLRACLLWVTTTHGGEAFWPIADLVEEYCGGLFFTNVTIPTAHA